MQAIEIIANNIATLWYMSMALVCLTCAVGSACHAWRSTSDDDGAQVAVGTLGTVTGSLCTAYFIFQLMP